MNRRLVRSSSLLVLAAALFALWKGMQTPPAPAAATASPVAAAPPATVPQPEPEPALPDPEPPVAESELSPDHTERVLGNPIMADRARQHELAPAADARWHEAVDGGEYRADDLDPAVRDLFRDLDLEPRYAEGGRIEGLSIRSLSLDHPLAQLGFRAGDRIDRIQGVPLSDPAELPSLLARLGPHFSLCADRDGSELCRELTLE